MMEFVTLFVSCGQHHKYGCYTEMVIASDFQKSSSANGIISNTFCNSATTGYYPMIMDVNNDGYDDIMCAFDDVSNDGKVRGYYMPGKASEPSFPEGEVYIAEVSAAVIAKYGNQTLTEKALFKTRTYTKYQSQCDHVTVSYPVKQHLYQRNNPWCECNGQCRMFSGDFDGDGYCDVICFDVYGYGYVMMYIVDLRRLRHPHWLTNSRVILESYCGRDMDRFKVLDLDRDGRAEFVCGSSADPTDQSYQVTVTRYLDNGPPIIDGGVPGWMEIDTSDVFNIDQSDPVVSRSASLSVASVPDTVNPCENITRIMAYLQANALSVTEDAVGAFCKDPSVSNFMSADVDGNGYCDMMCQNSNDSEETSVYVQYLKSDGETYETRHNLPVGTSGLGLNFMCPVLGELYTIDFNADGQWDLFCNNTNTSVSCGTEINVTYWLSQGDGSGFAPDMAPLFKTIMSDLLLGPLICPVCNLFNVSDGVVVFDTSTRIFEITCNPGYHLRGHKFVRCVPGSYYESAFPLCLNMSPMCQYSVFDNRTLAPALPRNMFLSAAFDVKDVVAADYSRDCILACEANASCMSATLEGNVCKLFAFHGQPAARANNFSTIILQK